MTKTLPDKQAEEIQIDNAIFNKINDEINKLAEDIRPTGNKEGTTLTFMKGLEAIVKSHNINFSTYCSDVGVRRDMGKNKK